MDFGELQREVFAAHGQGAYGQALELIDEHEQAMSEEHRPRLTFWRACFLSLDGSPQEALAILDAALEEGVWWDPAILERDPDLEGARRLPGWSDYRRRLLDHQDAVAATTAPRLVVEQPDSAVARPCPSVIVLHPAWGSAARTRPDWGGVLDAGWVLALAQSSQPAGTDAFVWSDFDKAISELQGHFDSLASSFEFDAAGSVVGGFSQGAGVGLAAVLTRQVPARRFVALAPTFGTVPLDINTLTSQSTADEVEGHIIVGSEDRAYDQSVRMARQLSETGRSCNLEVVEGLGHAPPRDFSRRLARILRAWTP